MLKDIIETRAHRPPTTAPEVQMEVQTCSRCIYTEETPWIEFDENGECNYCKMSDEMNLQYPTGEAGWNHLIRLSEEIKKSGKGKKYDVMIGVSGGCDSSLLLHLAKQLGLRPLAVHYDNTWNTKIAVENINALIKKLNIDLYTHVVDNEVVEDIYRSFFLAGSPDIDCSSDLAMTTVMYEAAEKYGVKYVFDGHSFRTEGVSPLGWAYMDMKYIETIVKKYGHYRDHRFRTYPALWMHRFIKWMVFRPIKRIRPLYYVDYNKEETKQMLTKEYGWQWYDGHHLENRFSAFAHLYFFPKRFKIDQRRNGFSALVRSGQMDRLDGINLMKQEPSCPPELLSIVKKRLGFSDTEFDRVMSLPIKTFRDFKTYKSFFERFKLFFWLMYKLDRIPRSFFQKYTSKMNI